MNLEDLEREAELLRRRYQCLADAGHPEVADAMEAWLRAEEHVWDVRYAPAGQLSFSLDGVPNFRDRAFEAGNSARLKHERKTRL